MVVGERQKNLGGGKYETQYEVKWKGYEKKHNTYEPLSNLAGCEDMVAEYKERKRQRDAELEAPRMRLRPHPHPHPRPRLHLCQPLCQPRQPLAQTPDRWRLAVRR